MAAWLIPALKIIGPHIGTIVSAATPAFTNRVAGKQPDASELAQQQISELQAAVANNADNTRQLAAQLQQTVEALEQAAGIAQRKLRRAVIFSLSAAVLSVVSVAIAAFLLLTR